MDVYCTKCGEPWDTDTFHDIADEQGISYNEAYAKFRVSGCKGTGWAKCSEPDEEVEDRYGLRRQDAMAALSDLLGDDIDGIASEMADLFG